MVSETGSVPEKVVYRETSYFGAWLWLMVLSLVGLYIAVTIGAMVKGLSGWYVFFGVVAVLLLVLFINFWRLEFVITETHVTFGFGLVKKSFKRSDIISCEPFELKFSNYLGYGIRYGLDRTVAYNTRNGDGIKLVIRGVKRPYVVSVKNSGYISKILST
jgi:hypothetical protein